MPALKNSDLIIQVESQASVHWSSPNDYHMEPGWKTTTLKSQSVFVTIKAQNVFCWSNGGEAAEICLHFRGASDIHTLIQWFLARANQHSPFHSPTPFQMLYSGSITLLSLVIPAPAPLLCLHSVAEPELMLQVLPCLPPAATSRHPHLSFSWLCCFLSSSCHISPSLIILGYF